MSDQPENPFDHSHAFFDHTRTPNSPTADADVSQLLQKLAADEVATNFDNSQVVLVDVSLTGNSSLVVGSATVAPLQEIGRYRVERVIGKGGFGVVYMAHDDQLKRRVAIKVPQDWVIRRPDAAKKYLIEAQIVAKLEHPFIVPVYDVGETANGLPYIVSRYIEGCNLDERMTQSRLPFRELVQVVIRMAEALGYAHDCKLVHRDVKPGNILLEDGSKPFLVDFGLALREEDIGKGYSFDGTPAYMSPEQANGEGHRVDGRSDIYSLGVVLYELLTGERPHLAKKLKVLLKQIVETDPLLPRQIDETIPPELERITLKALAKRASDRYATALELADDLRYWLNHETNTAKKEQGDAKIVPKGLRSFDGGDTDFFLELLPGPRDREGLPESLRFWKKRIEETDPAKTFRVGVIYGPSGCGNSSFVKAGLFPRLAERVRVVYIEATPDETESKLLRGLEQACPDLPRDGTLKDALIYLRSGGDTSRKVLLVIDQFEQWLYAAKNREHAGLVLDLRHCDGENVQCIVMVRDDFWLALNQFMKTLEIRLVEGNNFAAVYLFDLKHARNVLSAFGRAYGALPAKGLPSPEQDAFITQAVDGLAQEGKVISVRLALYAEMMKGRDWTSATLAEVGGTEGIGVTFLEETFSSRSAPPEHRHHQEAARGVLRALLPALGTDIKRHKRSMAELQSAADYRDQPGEFSNLLAILDSELRLITLTDTEGVESLNASDRYYELTHDFLVPSLREWLTRKQKESMQGRTELLLEDRSGVWNARPENRQLPTLFQWIRIRRMISKKTWTAPQAKMMAKAGHYHGLRLSLFGLFVFVASVTGFIIQSNNTEQRNKARAAALVDTLLASETSRVPDVIRELNAYRQWALPLLQEKLTNAPADSQAKLYCSLVMLESDPEEADYLYAQMLKANPAELTVIREALMPYREILTERLWDLARHPKTDKSLRLRAAAALSKYSPEDLRWQEISGHIVSALVAQKAFEQLPWGKLMEQAGKWLLAPLADALVDERRSMPDRMLIANLYEIYAKFEPEGYARLERIMNQSPDPMGVAETRYAKQKRQARTAIALLLLDQTERVWPLLRHTPDPTVRTLLIDQMARSGLEANVLFTRLDREPEVSARRALIQVIGEYGLDRLPATERKEIEPRLMNLYRDDPDAGVHSSTAYLLRKWGMGKDVLEIDRELQKSNPVTDRNWYVNDQGQTMVKITNPAMFWMGERNQLRRRRIGRSYAIAATEVTADQFQRFLKERPLRDFHYAKERSTTPDSPINNVSWYDAAAYCNWLSEKEGIPKEQWCYVPNKLGDYTAGMEMKKDFVNLTGYRLPTAAEWENACRAGSDTSFTFGEAYEQLGNYAWYKITTRGATSYSVGELRPNDYGLFDVHGNVWEWCQDRYSQLSPLSWKGNSIPDSQDDLTPVGLQRDVRFLCGGSFVDDAMLARSATRNGSVIANRMYFIGFRPARTFHP